jgi:hypothetical protein
MALASEHPGAAVPSLLAFFDRADRASLPGLLERLADDVLARGDSLLIHVEGTRARTCRHRPRKLGGPVLDLALRRRLPIVPVRFVGGLPVDPAPKRHEFPVGHGAQDIHLGPTITPEQLAARSPAARVDLVLGAIADLGPAPERTDPCDPDPTLAAVAARGGLDEVTAVLLEVLRRCPTPSQQTQVLLGLADPGTLPPAQRDWLTAAAQRLTHGPADRRGN